MPPTEQRMSRYSYAERAVHWMVAFGFVYATLTGLAIWSPRLYWLAALLGGGDTVRGWHPWGGVLFSLVLGFMFRNWAKQMRLNADDRVWLHGARRYAVHDDASLPESGRFNAGQKLLFWLQSIAAILLLASGLILWFPSELPRNALLAAILVHPITAILSICAIVVHIYMGTVAVPESLRGMVQGWVRPGWAEFHHRKWFREISKR